MSEAWTPASRDCQAPRTAATLGGPAPYWRSYSFDGSGNRKTEVVHGTADTTRTYGYPAQGGAAGTKPHAVTEVTGPVTQQFAYDLAGNMVCRPSATGANTCGADGAAGAGSQQLTWNHEGRVQKLRDGQAESSFVYDADGNRVLRREPGASTLYLPDGTELRTPASGPAIATRYYTHDGATIAVRTPAGVKWLVSDHQGTASAAVNNDATLAVTRRRSLPFGEVRGAQPAVWTGDRGFVGGTKDSTGLTHMRAREYDPALGRFISVDPVIDLMDPQQWNGYDYANNNPVTSADPSGMKFCSDDACGPGADWVDSTGKYHEEDGHNDGCGGCSGSPDPTYVKPPPTPSNPAKSNSPPAQQKRNKCSGWDMWCKGKKAASTTWEAVKENKADLIGVAVGVVVGVTCTAITGGAGAVVCGMLAGAVGSFVKSRVEGDSWKETALMTGTGALFGAAGDAAARNPAPTTATDVTGRA
jgi:RHS repeat-associated protein